MNVLLISNMYPSNANPANGTFLKEQALSLTDYVNLTLVVKTNKSKLGYISFAVKTLIKSLNRRYDLIHAHYGFHSALIPMICRCKPLLITFHGSDVLVEPSRNFIYKLLQRMVIAYASHLIAVGEQVYDCLINDLGANPDKISLIPCGVNINLFKPRSKKDIRKQLNIPIDSKVVLFIGDLTEAKGVNLIQKAALTLNKINFYMVGAGPIRWTSLNTNFLGTIEHSKIPEWINAADLLLLPSQYEGAGLVVLEALASGTPVISTKVGVCPELIKDGVTGILINKNNSDELILAIKRAFNITFSSTLGRQLVEQKYSLNFTANRLSKLYEKILQS